MMRIAICDDMEAELQRIASLTMQYIKERDICADIRTFSHPDALLTACELKPFHIYLLDMVMPMMSGLELGRSIRRMNTDAQIIFITTEPGFALDAYSVTPLHYLIKPVDTAALFSALDLAAKKVDYGEEITVTIKTKEGLRTFSISSIACCEYVRHTVVYTLASGERVETTTIQGRFTGHVAQIMGDRRFIQPHAAYVVNMSRVERLTKDGFTLKGGTFVPVSGKHFATTRNAYMSYRLGEA